MLPHTPQLPPPFLDDPKDLWAKVKAPEIGMTLAHFPIMGIDVCRYRLSDR